MVSKGKIRKIISTGRIKFIYCFVPVWNLKQIGVIKSVMKNGINMVYSNSAHYKVLKKRQAECGSLTLEHKAFLKTIDVERDEHS